MNSMLLQATFRSGGVLLVFWVGYYFFLLRRIVLHNAGYLAFLILVHQKTVELSTP